MSRGYISRMNRAGRLVLRALVVAILIAACAAAQPASATAPGLAQPTGLVADASRAGVINLIFFGPRGARVYFDERVGPSLKRLGSTVIGPYGGVFFPEAAVWRCDRLVRSFEATAVGLDGSRTFGTYDVRTPSCASRFQVDAPQRVAPGQTARIRMIDGWEIGGVKPRLCITAPGGHVTCKNVTLRRAVSLASRGFHATKRGLWRVVLRINQYVVRAAVAVGRSARLPPRLPVVLATGDSTMQGVDSFLTDHLADRATVRSDVFVGTGISSSLDWVKRAPRQAARDRPRATVVSIGANDSADMQTPEGAKTTCCGAAWIAEYARRVRGIMKAYLHNGRGRVIWMTVPVARDALRAAYGTVVNAAIRRAAGGLHGVTVLPLERIFTPNGYRDVMRWRGRDIRVRAPDGVHLSAAGTAIAAEIVQATLGDL